MDVEILFLLKWHISCGGRIFLEMVGKHIMMHKEGHWSTDQNCTERPGTGILNLNMLAGEVRSYRTCFLYFFNFIEQKTAKSFIEFVRFSYLTCVNIYDHHMTDESVFDRSEPALLQYIYDYARRILEECKRENIYGICLNCLPKYTNTGLLSYVPKEKEYLFREYYAEAITPFVDVLTNEDLGCCRLAVKLIAEGYDRKDLRDYPVLHNGVLLRSFFGMLADRGFSDCCPVPPGFAAQCPAEKVMDKRLKER